MITDALGAAYGQERVTALSAELLSAAGHDVRYITSERRADIPLSDRILELPGLFEKNWLTSSREISRYTGKMDRFFKAAPPDIVHFIEVPEHRIVEWVTPRYRAVTTAHLVSLTCPASHRLITGGGTCEKKSGWSCLWHNKSYGCLNFLKTDLHRAHAIRNYQLKRRALADVPVLAVSESLRERMIADGWAPDNVWHVPNPVVVPASIPVLAGAPDTLIVAACRLVPLKGLDRLLKAFAPLSTAAHLWICGDGPERETLENLSRAFGYGSRVRFLGALSHRETLRVMRAARIVVQPNLGPETFGMSVAEASALGRPVVASDVGGLNEVLAAEETALLVPAGSVDDLQEALRRLLDSAELRQKLGDGGIRRMKERYSPEIHLKAQVAAYEQIISSS